MQLSTITINKSNKILESKNISQKENINKKDTNQKLETIYNSIFKWKDFCHKQIKKGNFNIIT